MKFDATEDYRIKIRRITRMVENAKSRRTGFTVPELSEETRQAVEEVTRFEQYRGLVYKQCGNRQREMGTASKGREALR